MLIKRGARAWDQRTYVTGARKIWVVLRGILILVRSVLARCFQPWSPGTLRTIWKYTMFSNTRRDVTTEGTEITE